MITIDQYTDFFSRYNRNLVNFAQAYLRNREQAEDCAMDACMKMWERRAEIVVKSDDDLLRWSLTVVRNRCINILRRQKLMVTDSSDEAWAVGERLQGLENFEPQDICFAEIHGIVTEALRRMPSRTREVFLDCSSGDYAHDEVAARHNITTRGVEYHLYKARRILRDALGDYVPAAFLFVGLLH